WRSALRLWASASAAAAAAAAASAAASVCAEAEEWRRAQEVLLEVHALQSNVVTRTCAVNACVKGTQWARALLLHGLHVARHLRSNSVAFTVACQACGKGQRWRQAVSLLAQTDHDEVALTCALDAMSKSGDCAGWRAALRLEGGEPLLRGAALRFSWRWAVCRGADWAAKAEAMEEATKTMKAMKAAKAMTKGGIVSELASATDMKKSEVSQLLGQLSEIGAKEVKATGKFVIPGLCMIKTRTKPATKAGKRMMFGKEVAIKAQPAKTATKTMKAMKAAKAMTKGGIVSELASATDMKKSEVSQLLGQLSEIGAKEVKATGKFVIPGLCMIKTRTKPATKAGKRMMFGKEVAIKAQPAKTVVKAFAVSALKKQI
ncbi:unnamed protein product, partial [Effrenium voratum]